MLISLAVIGKLTYHKQASGHQLSSAVITTVMGKLSSAVKLTYHTHHGQAVISCHGQVVIRCHVQAVISCHKQAVKSTRIQGKQEEIQEINF